jgi:flagellar M-ring protein FliF
MTEFVQKLNYQRALQGELARTISQLGGVEQARVHLVIPEKSLFKDAEKPPTASVVLKMKGSGSLRESEVQGIIHLVAASIEGMDPDNVSVIDQKGKVLSRGVSQDQNGKMTSAMLDTQRNFEKGTEDRLQSLLDRVVGPGKSVARVSATFDFKQVEKFEERYDPESAAVRSEQRSEEKNGAGSAVSGVPGVQTNLGRTTPGANAAGGSGGSRSDETLNYEVSRMTARIIEPVGSLAKISVAILVDGKYDGAGKEGAAKAKYAARSPEELQKIEALVKSAVGFNGDRGDQVTVANIPFLDTSEEPQPAYKEMLNSPVVGSLLKNVLIGVAFLGVLFLVIRPMMKSIRATLPQSFEPEISPEEEAQKLIAQERAQKTRASMSQLDLIEKVKGDPYQAAQIIQNWIETK